MNFDESRTGDRTGIYCIEIRLKKKKKNQNK